MYSNILKHKLEVTINFICSHTLSLTGHIILKKVFGNISYIKWNKIDKTRDIDIPMILNSFILNYMKKT